MTLEEAAQDVWEQLGEPTDLAFRVSGTGVVNGSSAGWVALRRALERGMIATMHAKIGRSQRHVRWKGSTKVASYLGGKSVAVTVVSVNGLGIVVAESAPVDTYLGWFVDDGVELRRVAYSGNTLIVLGEAFGQVPVIGSTLTLRQGFFAFPANRGLLRVTDTVTGRDVEITRPEDITWNVSPSTGDPTSYYHLNARVYLEPVPVEERYFIVEEESYPTLVATMAGDELPIPQPLQYAAVLWAISWGFGRYLNPEMKSSIRKEWRETLLETQLPEDNLYDRQDEAVEVRRA